jgi:hypothetical protein
LLSLLKYHVHGDPGFSGRATALLPKLRAALARYLCGKGHPSDPILEGLIDVQTWIEDNQDPSYCAHRFVKLLSGVTLLPPSDVLFAVRFVLTFNGLSAS